MAYSECEGEQGGNENKRAGRVRKNKQVSAVAGVTGDLRPGGLSSTILGVPV